MGALTFKEEPDYEAPTDSPRKDNVYEVTVQATDTGDNTVSKKVKVTVTNVEENGRVSLSHTHPEVGGDVDGHPGRPRQAQRPRELAVVQSNL